MENRNIVALTPEIISQLSPGIRDLVVWLNQNRFDTCDSGDGSNHRSGMACAFEQPMVAIFTSPSSLAAQADRLHLLLTEAGVCFDPPGPICDENGVPVPCTWPNIQATYDPADGVALIVLLNVTSDMIRP